jgi:hypothetical protein
MVRITNYRKNNYWTEYLGRRMFSVNLSVAGGVRNRSPACGQEFDYKCFRRCDVGLLHDYCIPDSEGLAVTSREMSPFAGEWMGSNNRSVRRRSSNV